jgi:hypothetical protein
MSGSRKLLIFGGITLAAFGMLYGLHYALFVEHQMLDRMGGSLATAFTQVAARNWSGSESALADYADTKYKYVRQVDVHSHWIGLGMLMIVLGVAFERVGFSERSWRWIAAAFMTGSVVFPLGVILQTAKSGAALGSALAVVGSALVTVALAAVAIGFWRRTV